MEHSACHYATMIILPLDLIWEDNTTLGLGKSPSRYITLDKAENTFCKSKLKGDKALLVVFFKDNPYRLHVMMFFLKNITK
jgi:hypothetical protein